MVVVAAAVVRAVAVVGGSVVTAVVDELAAGVVGAAAVAGDVGDVGGEPAVGGRVPGARVAVLTGPADVGASAVVNWKAQVGCAHCSKNSQAGGRRAAILTRLIEVGRRHRRARPPAASASTRTQ